MLKNLLKYEFKATRRTYGGLYLVWLLLGLLLGVSMRQVVWNQDVSGWQLWYVLMLLYVGITIAAGVVCIMTIIQRFTKNLLGREGYLMHTLPVNEYQLVGSKLISSLVWVVCSAVVGLLSTLMIVVGLCAFRSTTEGLVTGTDRFGNDVTYTWGQFLSIVGDELAGLGGKFWMTVAWDVFVGLVVVAVLILCVYAACMVGHLFKKHTTVASIVAFFLLQNVQGRLGGMAGFGNLIHITVNSADVWSASPATSVSYLWVNLVITVAFGVVYFMAASLLMKKKLDLE